jgi:aspartyl-tRNA(Asn)/glutamyl-tRNA(Gln) amidotransferase subunit A
MPGEDYGCCLAVSETLWQLGVTDLLAAYGAKKLTPTTLLQTLIARAGENGPAPRAVLRTIPGAAAAAEESGQRWRNGTARALEGVPFGVKDIIDVAGAVVTHGSLQTGNRHATTDATCVARLRAAGAIPIFMLATSEYACGAPVNARYGVVPNPWDNTRWAGGSSTGSGAAIAARLMPLALGSDTGGSIRIPAALCGITGLKPTQGLVPHNGVATLSWTLDHIGPMARSAADIARVLPILVAQNNSEYEAKPSPEGLRIGVPGGWFTDRCDSAVLAAWRDALAILRHGGATLHDVDLPDPAEAHEDAWQVLYAELASDQEHHAATFDLFDAGTRDRITRGQHVRATDYLRALRQRPLVQHNMLAAMADVDVVITPGVGAEAPFLSDITVQLNGTRIPMYEVTPRNTMILNYTGFPALMLPAGFGAGGLPIAIQIVGKPFQDALCLSVGMAFQSLTTHHTHTPPMPASVQ